MSTWLWWSTGKDSAWSLHVLRERGVEVTGLITTITRAFERVSVHGVRTSVLEAQVARAGLPLNRLMLPFPCRNEDYEDAVGDLVMRARDSGVRAMAFGDLFLDDVRAYRERILTGTGIEPLFPLWGQDTFELAEAMLDAGLEARVTCLDPTKVGRELAGARFDHGLLRSLPDGVDPCGERGEFHTCVTAGPMLSPEVRVRPGAVVEREGFIFADLELESGGSGPDGSS